jgi:hypothetical protein
MRVSEQIEAMEVSAINPFKYLVVTRTLATSLMIPALSIYCSFVGLLGSYLNVYTHEGTTVSSYLKSGFSTISFLDLGSSVFKALVYGFTIGIISCYKGFTCSGGASGVGRASTESFVASFIAIIVINLVLAWRGLPESVRRRTDAPPVDRWRVVRQQLAMKSLRDALRTPALGALVVMSFLHVLSFTQLESTFALHLCARLGFGMRETGFAFALIGLVVAVVQGGILGRVARKYGETALVRTGLTLLVAGMALTAMLPAAAGANPSCAGGLALATLVARSSVLVAAIAVTSVGNALVTPSVSTLVSKVASRDGYGAVLGAQQSAGALARVLGPTTAGLVYERWGSAAPYWLACAGMIAALSTAWTLRAPGIEPRRDWA